VIGGVKLSISFKSVGDLTVDRKFSTLSSETPVGIKTPLSLGDREVFTTNNNLAEQVNDNVRNLILTNWGERLGFYDMGANLRELTMEMTSDEFDREAMLRIKRAVSKWMPFVELEMFDKQLLGRQSGANYTRVKLTVVYNVPLLGVRNRGVEIMFNVAG
jgi:phage baseplate assembly protein W